MFLIVGEALIDMVASAEGTYRPVPGGAPFNFARALALQGLPATYVNPFSADAFGILLKRTLEASGARHLGRISQRPTSLALVSTDAHGHPHYSFYRAEVADREWDSSALLAIDPDAVAAFHTGALALVPPDHRFVLDAARRFHDRGALCTLDVNMRPQVAASQGIEPTAYREAAQALIGCADIVKVSDEDLRHLEIAGDPRAAARELLAVGPKLVVLTLGAEGAWAISAQAEVFQSAERVAIADTVGAGDCFFAGFVACLQRAGAFADLRDHAPAQPALSSALAHASVCAAINISRQGCQPPTWEEARNRIEK